jgi:hypothetical protein
MSGPSAGGFSMVLPAMMLFVSCGALFAAPNTDVGSTYRPPPWVVAWLS